MHGMPEGLHLESDVFACPQCGAYRRFFTNVVGAAWCSSCGLSAWTKVTPTAAASDDSDAYQRFYPEM